MASLWAYGERHLVAEMSIGYHFQHFHNVEPWIHGYEGLVKEKVSGAQTVHIWKRLPHRCIRFPLP